MNEVANGKIPTGKASPGLKAVTAGFAVAAIVGLVVVFVAADVHGFAGAVVQSVGIALFTAGLIAFPLAILGHNELTKAADSNLRQLQNASADKILEERLSERHIRTLRDDTFGKPIIEKYTFVITLDDDNSNAAESPGITLVYGREYVLTNVNAAPTLIDLYHHVSGPTIKAADRSEGFVYAYLEVDDDVLQWSKDDHDLDWSASPDARFEKRWHGSAVTIGREQVMGNIYTLQVPQLRLDPGSTLRAHIISETEVSSIGAEPFIVFLPTMEIDVIVRSAPNINVAVFPMPWEQKASETVRLGPRVAARGTRMQEVRWRWDKALFAGQGIMLRWARIDPPAADR